MPMPPTVGVGGTGTDGRASGCEVVCWECGVGVLAGDLGRDAEHVEQVDAQIVCLCGGVAGRVGVKQLQGPEHAVSAPAGR